MVRLGLSGRPVAAAVAAPHCVLPSHCPLTSPVRCGQCKGQQPCTVAEGRCLTCEPGWNGTKCDQPCATGFYGEGCGHRCPPCRDGHACNHVTGKCPRCNAGWIGDR